MTITRRKGATMNKGDKRSFGPVDTYTRLAPSVAKEWVEAFVLEQRLLGVPGKRIGDSLAVIESHVAESGESAQVAFGDPTAYAKEDAPEDGDSPDRLEPGWILGIILGLAGMLLTVFGAQAGFAGEPAFRVTVGVVVLVTMTAGTAALVSLAPRILSRVLTTHPIRGWFGWLLLLAVSVVILLVLRHPLGEIAIVGMLVVGVILLTAGFLLQLRIYRNGSVDEDPILGPGEQPSRSRTGMVSLFIFPGMTIVAVGFSWLIQAIPTLF